MNPRLVKAWRERGGWITTACACVAQPDEQSWPSRLPCSCTRCLQIRLGGVRGACGRRAEEAWGLSWATLADTHTPHLLYFRSLSLPCSHFTVQQMKKINTNKCWFFLFVFCSPFSSSGCRPCLFCSHVSDLLGWRQRGCAGVLSNPLISRDNQKWTHL